MTDSASDKAPCICQTCCSCQWLYDRHQVGQFEDLKVKFSGALSGECILTPNQEYCNLWDNRWLDQDNCLVDPCALNVTEVLFYCAGPGPCEEHLATIVINNIGCHPRLTPVKQQSLICPPDGPFELVFRWELVEDGPMPWSAGRCCGFTEIIATITEP